MKNIRFALLLLLPFILVNCEEVIPNFTLKNAAPKLVIDAQVSSYLDSAIVKISTTANYMNSTEYPTISGAEVTLSFGDTSLILTEQNPGDYKIPFAFPENTNYTITVKYDNQTYTAKSLMHKKVILDSLSVVPYAGYFPMDPKQKYFQVLISFKDNKTETNFYRIKVTKNDTLFNNAEDLMVTDDTYFTEKDGRVDFPPSYAFESGDTVLVELQSIDKANYLYYTTLLNALGSTGGFSVPDNPTSNFSGGVLGHFDANSSDTLQIIIP